VVGDGDAEDVVVGAADVAAAISFLALLVSLQLQCVVVLVPSMSWVLRGDIGLCCVYRTQPRQLVYSVLVRVVE